MCSTRRGSWPISSGARSLMTPTTPFVFHSRDDSPQPTSPATSVSILTKTQLASPPFTIRGLTAVIFTGGGRSRGLLELLGQRHILPLVRRPDVHAVDPGRPLGQPLVLQPADDLPVLELERHLVAAHFEHGPRAHDVVPAVAEAGVEEARVMDPELA